MNLNLTCQKTHILAWINSDNTLSLKLNGVKHLAYPKLDKRGGKYWKVDSPSAKVQTNEANLPKLDLNKPIGEYTKAELALWQAQQATQPESKSMTANEYLAKLAKEREQIEKSGQKTLEQLAQKLESKVNHESTNPN